MTTTSPPQQSVVAESVGAAMSTLEAADYRDPLLQTRRLNFTSRVKMGRLPNGLAYRILPHTYPQDRVLAHLVVNAGSINEESNELGIAHFLEVSAESVRSDQIK
eukprot:Selendium_serpulae@DN1870_c0_g1_i1.p1